MYFLFFKLHCQSKRSAAQPQAICSEVPLRIRMNRGWKSLFAGLFDFIRSHNRIQRKTRRGSFQTAAAAVFL